MKAGAFFLLFLLPSFALTPLGQTFSRNRPRMSPLNAPAFDSERFREPFGRTYEVNGHRFERRRFFLQVGGLTVAPLTGPYG